VQAHLGDRLVVESQRTGAVRRDGEIVGLHHEDGTPPYDVRWSDTDEVTLVFPGPDAHIRHIERHGRPGTSRPDPDATGTEPDAPPRTPHATAPEAGPSGPGDIGRRITPADQQAATGCRRAAPPRSPTR
jgi:hypothetical protein